MKAGKVTRTSKYGIQLDGVDEWFNWSRDLEDRTTADRVQKDDVVQVAIVDDKFVTSIEILPEPPSGSPAPSPDGNDQWVLKDRRLGRQTAAKASAEIMAAFIGNHSGVEWSEILKNLDDLLEKYGAFID